MKLKPQYIASTEGGKFRIVGMTGKEWSAELLRMFPDMRLTITVEKKKKARSNQQNNFYWGVINPLIRDGLNDAGYKFESDETHDFLKDHLLPSVDIVSPVTGEVKKQKGSTRKLSTVEFMEFEEDCKRFAAEFLGVYIPDPNEQTTMTFE